MRSVRGLWLLVFAFALATPRQGLGADPDICPRTKRKPVVYMIGSSTMGSTLGPMLKGQLRRKLSIAASRWGKASSGLARPDFHDWPSVARGLMAKHRPDLVIVSLGTNDNQHIKKRRGWLHLVKDEEKWDAEYAKRVRQMLERLSGKKHKRPIIWVGPVALRGKNARRNGPRITRIVRTAIKEFDGQALLLDLYHQTVGEDGDPVLRLDVGSPEQPRMIRARSKDGQHLSIEAVQALMVDPILSLLADCEERRMRTTEKTPDQTTSEAEAAAPAADVATTDKPEGPAGTAKTPEAAPTDEPDDSDVEDSDSEELPKQGREDAKRGSPKADG